MQEDPVGRLAVVPEPFSVVREDDDDRVRKDRWVDPIEEPLV